MTSVMALHSPVTDEEICGDVPMTTIEPSSTAPSELSTSFTPINAQDAAPTQDDEGEAGLEKDTANLDVNGKTSPKKRAASNAPPGAKVSPTKKRAAPKLKKIAPKPAEQNDGAADLEEPSTPIKKSAPKAKAKKGTATKAIKPEPETDADELAGSGAEPAPTPAKKTPKPKAPKKTTAAKAIKKEVTPDQPDNDAAPVSDAASPTASPTKASNGDGAATTALPSGKARKRQAPKNDTRSKAMIPKSYDEASDVDRMLYDLKEAGTGWKTICAKYEEMTGEEVGMKSLGSRYTRMKTNMMRLKPGHAFLTLQALHRIESDFEAHKYNQLATAVREATNEGYPTEFLKKQVKELKANGGVAGLDEEEKAKGEKVGKGGESEEGGMGDEGEGDVDVGGGGGGSGEEGVVEADGDGEGGDEEVEMETV